MTLLLAIIMSFQQVQVESRIDLDRIDVGGTVTLTIVVEATGNAPVQIMNPSIAGMELLGTSDQSTVTINEGVATRFLTRTLRLRATNTGTARIGATFVQVGTATAQADAIEIQIEEGGDTSAGTLAPHILDLVERHIPTRLSADDVLVEVLATTDSVVLGDQLDLAVVAWFPQHIRAQLRTPPTLQPPELQGAWTYSEGIPHAVDLRRRIGNTWYQVYVHSVVVFPLTPGFLDIGPATVSYSLPMSYSFLSREVRHEPQSDNVLVFVGEQPIRSRPSSFSGAAGSGLRLSVQAMPAELSVGEASVVTAVLSGEGNVALWPEPRIGWPVGIRAYPEGSEVVLEPDAERITGSKTFRYLVVPDSSGTHLIGGFDYSYYDVATSRYTVLRIPDVVLRVETAATPRPGDRTETRSLMREREGSFVEHMFENAPSWWWLLALLGAPIAAGAAVAIPRALAWRGRNPRTSVEGLHLQEQEFVQILHDLVGDAERADSDTLSAALRAAGIDAPIAAHAARARERLWQVNYGPDGDFDPEELTAEITELLNALAGETQRATGQAHTAATVTLLIGFVLPPTLMAQPAEHFYEAGALQTAADSFAARAEVAPWNVAHWYNLGAALERTGEIQRTRRAWIRAARRAPRDARVRRAIDQLPPLDTMSSSQLRISLFTPAETFLAAAVLWILAWGCVGARLRRSMVVLAILLAVACTVYGAFTTRRYNAPLALVIAEDTPLRAAPFGLAQSRRALTSGTTVFVRRETAPWILVERGGESGWLLRDEVVTIQ